MPRCIICGTEKGGDYCPQCGLNTGTIGEPAELKTPVEGLTPEEIAQREELFKKFERAIDDERQAQEEYFSIAALLKAMGYHTHAEQISSIREDERRHLDIIRDIHMKIRY